MARSSTTLVKGQRIALKHGAYSAQAAWHDQVTKEANRQYRVGRLTPLENDCRKTLIMTKALLKKTYAYVMAQGGPIDPKGKVLPAALLLDRLLMHVNVQAATLWRMLNTNPTPEAEAEADYFKQYAPTAEGPDARMPTSAAFPSTPQVAPATDPSPAAPAPSAS